MRLLTDRDSRFPEASRGGAVMLPGSTDGGGATDFFPDVPINGKEMM